MKLEEYVEFRALAREEKGRKEGMNYILNIIEILSDKFRLSNFSWLKDLNIDQLNEIEELASTIDEKEEFEKQVSKFIMSYNF